MQIDELGLFDAPPRRDEVRIALALSCAIIFLGAALLALPRMQLPPVHAFIPITETIMLFGDLVTATLLYCQATIFRSRALTALASGYVFTALLLAAHLVSFPGVFTPEGLLGGGLNTTAWIGACWRCGIPLAIIAYVIVRRVDAKRDVSERKAGVRSGIVMSATSAVVLVALATRSDDWFPHLFITRTEMDLGVLFAVNCAIVALYLAAIAMLAPNRKSVLDLWLLVTLLAWLVHSSLSLGSTGRFTLSFYSQFSLLMFSHLTLLLALLAESNRLFMRLAISTAERKFEQDSRLMSMDAVAAAIAHEVGQPLNAIATSARAGLNWLSRPHPDLDKARQAQKLTLEATERTFDVIRSTREMFAKGQGTATEFDLNDLVEETTRLLRRELRAGKVSASFELDESLPEVHGNRVQIQQVLVNLLKNAIECFRTTSDPSREIVISSRSVNGSGVMLEVSNTGPSISREKLPHIFDPFFTTKQNGAGLGLPLSRKIVEDHGGKLSASPGEGRGTTFHLQLPTGRLH